MATQILTLRNLSQWQLLVFFVSPHSAFWYLRKSHLGFDQPECFDLKDMSLRKHRVSSGKHVKNKRYFVVKLDDLLAFVEA